jgi:hypothetical protein
MNVQDLGYDTTLTGLESLNGDMVAASCRLELIPIYMLCTFNMEAGKWFVL